MVWRGKWIVAVCVVFGVAAAVIYLQITPKTYTATATLHVQRSNPGNVGDMEGPRSLRQDETYLQTQSRLIRSLSVLTEVVERPIGLRAASLLGVPADTRIRELKTLAKSSRPDHLLKRKIEVYPGQNDELISIYLSSEHPDEARVIINAVMDEYIAKNSRDKIERAQMVSAPLAKKKEQYEKQLREKRDAIAKLAEREGRIDFSTREGNPELQRLSALQDQLQTVKVEVLKAQADFESAAGAIGRDPLSFTPDELQSTKLAELGEAAVSAELFTIRQQLKAAKEQYLAAHPIVVRLKQQVDEYGLGLAAAARQRLRNAQFREIELQRRFDALRQTLSKSGAVAAQYNLLDRQASLLEKQIADVNAQLAASELAREAGAMNIDVIDEATVPSEIPVKPRGSQILALGFGAGLLFGVLAALLREWANPRIRGARQLQNALALPVLGAIPRMQPKRKLELACWASYFEPSGELAEAYRSVRTCLQFGQYADARTVLVTSASRGEGKTTVASNLAIALAQAGQRTLIVDANFSQPSLAQAFQVSPEGGLCQLLRGEQPDIPVLKHTAVPRLDVLTAGARDGSAHELLNSPILQDVLRELAAHYDRVIVDSSALSEGNEARVLAAHCDATVIVVREGAAARQQLLEARDALWMVGARLAGVVVNASGRAYHVPHQNGTAGAHDRHVIEEAQLEQAVVQRRS